MFVPIHDNVLVKRRESDAVSAGGIHIPDQAQKKTQAGEVLAVGVGRTGDDNKLVPVCGDIKKGAVVYFDKYAGADITVDDEDYVVMREGEILGFAR